MKPTREQIDEARELASAYLSGKRPWNAETEDRVISTLLAATEPDPGPPRPDDMAELARLVAVELRKRWIWAAVASEIATSTIRYPMVGGAGRLCWKYTYTTEPRFDSLTPREIAVAIQDEEAKRAAEWAGDK